MMIIVHGVILYACLMIMMALTGGKSSHRIGITMLAAFAAIGIGIDSVALIEPSLSLTTRNDWFALARGVVVAWALWDTSRLSREYGTTTLLAAAELARGFIVSDEVEKNIWSAFVKNMPRAAWVKGPDGLMLAINDAYQQKYGKPAELYVGSTDELRWGKDVGREFNENDAMVWNAGRPILVEESAPIPGFPNRKALFLKFPIRDVGVTHVVAGFEPHD